MSACLRFSHRACACSLAENTKVKVLCFHHMTILIIPLANGTYDRLTSSECLKRNFMHMGHG